MTWQGHPWTYKLGFSFIMREAMEFLTPVFTGALSIDRLTQFPQGMASFCKTLFIFWKITSAVPQLRPLVLHISKNLWTTFPLSNIHTVSGFIFSCPAMIRYMFYINYIPLKCFVKKWVLESLGNRGGEVYTSNQLANHNCKIILYFQLKIYCLKGDNAAWKKLLHVIASGDHQCALFSHKLTPNDLTP